MNRIFMKSFYDREEYTTEDILSLIDNEVEESIYLDFKESGALEKSDGKRKEISKDVAAFANSDGGILIYGIKEANHIAHSLSFVNGNEYTKEWLEQIINSTIQRHIPDLKIFPIRFENSIEKSIYIVKVPKSIEAPHISKDRRFYKRYNFESVAMEEYEIRQLYGRRIKSKLIIGDYQIYKTKSDYENRVNLRFEASVINEGEIPESSYKLNVYFNNFNEHLKITWNQIQVNYDYTTFDNNRVKISAVSQTPIYPSEEVNVIRFTIEFEKDFLVEALNGVTFELLLFYPNGEDRLESTMEELMNQLIETDQATQ
jgi:predicted HTH transcriptional regulator